MVAAVEEKSCQLSIMGGEEIGLAGIIKAFPWRRRACSCKGDSDNGLMSPPAIHSKRGKTLA